MQMLNQVARYSIVLLLTVVSSAAGVANEPRFAIKEARRDANGVTFRTAAGTMRIEVCGERIIHVVASATSEIPSPRVPVVTQPCRANNLQVKVGKKDFKLSTAAITVTIDVGTGALSFLSRDGRSLLAEPKEGGKAFTHGSEAE